MSIINDALKKTQSAWNHQEQSKPQASSADKKDPLMLIFSAIIGTGFVGCVIILLLLIWPKQSPQTILTQISEPNDIKENEDLKLNGIINNDQERMALINNRVLRENEEIDGKKILSILDDQVKLYDNGNIIILEIQK